MKNGLPTMVNKRRSPIGKKGCYIEHNMTVSNTTKSLNKNSMLSCLDRVSKIKNLLCLCKAKASVSLSPKTSVKTTLP